MELDGVWTGKRVFWSIVGLLVGVFIYFYAKKLVLHPDDAGGKILLPEFLRIVSPGDSMLWNVLLDEDRTSGWRGHAWCPNRTAFDVGSRQEPALQGASSQTGHGRQLLFVCDRDDFVPRCLPLMPAEAGNGPFYLNVGFNTSDFGFGLPDQRVGAEQIYDATTPADESNLKGRGGRYFSNLSGFYLSVVLQPDRDFRNLLGGSATTRR